MGRKRHGSELFIFMNGERVGRLSRTAGGRLECRYADAWLDSAAGRGLSLSMPLTDQAYSGQVVENYFDNLLPDSQPIRDRIQKRFGAQSNRGFDLLWHIGRDCIGAIQLHPEDSAPDVHHIEAEPLTDADIAQILKNYATMPLGMQQDKDFRISIAGAQEKTALLNHHGQWHRPLGATPTSHLFKLPIGRIDHSGMDLSDSVENEWLCLAVLAAYGLPTAPSEIMDFAGTKALVVERFDRRWSTDHSWLIRLPQEDMCQALNVPPALKYESDGGPGIEAIMTLLLGSARSLEDRRTFMTQVFLFWLLGAIDGHGKNFSIALGPGGSFQLTPAYDVISDYPLIAQKQLNQKRLTMAMSLQGKNSHYHWEQMFRRHWLATAKRCKFPAEEMNCIIDESLEKLDGVIKQVSNLLPKGFPEEIAASLFEGMRTARERMD